MGQDWIRIKTLLLEALDQPDDNRETWIRQQCGDDEALVEELTELVESHRQADSGQVLEVPPAALLDPEPLRLERGARVGPWEVGDLIAEGGMGSVYRGERADGAYERTVAIKVLRPGRRQAEALKEHLHQEGRILARLEHPNIARFYDLGVATNGMPWIVMELVDGDPITEWANRTGAGEARRLDQFLAACSAVTHAHRNLIIHQDLKPSNVLVDSQGDAKLLDFGIAQIFEVLPTKEDKRDEQARGIGLTPGYAAPEQIDGGLITTATDVYALGVVLLELLTGERELTRGRLDRELGAIVNKALATDPEDRFATVSDLANDIRRYREGLMVSAVPNTASYRARTFVRRNKKLLVGVAVLLVALVGGLAGTLYQASIASRERDSAERRFDVARNVAGDLMFDLHDRLAEIPGSTRAREMVLRRSLAYLDSLAAEPDRDEVLRRDIAQAYLRIGNVMGSPINANLGLLNEARNSFTKGMSVLQGQSTSAGPRALPMVDQETYARLLEAMGAVFASMGQPDSSVVSLAEAVSLFESQREQHPGDPAALFRLATARVKLGDYLGNPNFPNTGDRAGALTHYREAERLLDEAVRLGDDGDPTLRQEGIVFERLGVLYAAADSFEAAGAAYRRSFEIRRELFSRNPNHLNIYRDLGIGHEKLALMYQNAGQLDSALVEFERSEEVYRDLTESDPVNVQAKQTLAIGLLHLGDLFHAPDMLNFGDAAAARRYFSEGLELLESTVEIDTSNVRTRRLIEIFENRLERTK